jgi:hypothetical protein
MTASSPTCKRYIICGIEGQEPVQTDDFEMCKSYIAADAYWIIDTQTGCYIEEGAEYPMEDISNMKL